MKRNKDQPATMVSFEYMVAGKVPPQARDLEEAVLGAIMLDKYAFDTAAEILKPECFYVDAHIRLFKCFSEMALKNIPIDILTVVEYLGAAGDLEIVGGPYWVTKLTNAVVSTANIETHSRIIFQKFVLRETIRISGDAINHAYENDADCFDLLDQTENELSAITSGIADNDLSNMGDNTKEFFETIDKRRLNQDSMTGVSSGFKAVDAITWGWQKTDLIIIAARPSVGKTAFSLNLAVNAARTGVPVGFFSLEMSKAQLTERIFAIESQINMDNLKKGKIDETQYSKLTYSSRRVEKLPVYIDDTAALNIIQFRRKARKIVREKKVGLIIIDYLQLMKGVKDSYGSNREQEVSDISRNLKILAKELNIPIIPLSQLSRDIEKRNNKLGEPNLSDLRESGAIEQDADLVIFIYKGDGTATDHIPGETFIKFGKHRNGIAGDKFKIIGKLHTQTFYNIDDPLAKDQSGIIRPIDYTAPKNAEGNFDDTFNEDAPF